MDGANSVEPRGNLETHLKPLTSLRFAAAMLVVLAHWQITAQHVPAMFGAAGVAFFFTLSGFILAHVHGGQFDRFPSWIDVRSFWVARIARIYPLHILTLTVVAALGLAHVAPPGLYGLAFGSQVLLVQSWIPLGTLPYAFNAPAWTISDEAFFYAVFPFAMWLLSRARLSIPKLILTIVSVWLVASTFDLLNDGSRPMTQWLIYVFPLPRLAEFVCGIMLGMIFERSRTSIGFSTATALEAAAVAFVAAGIAVSLWLPESYGRAACMLPAWACLIFVFALQRGFLSRLLSLQPLVILGEASFALYLVHHIVMERMTGFPVLITSLVLALAVHYVIEIPARKAIRRLDGFMSRDRASIALARV